MKFYTKTAVLRFSAPPPPVWGVGECTIVILGSLESMVLTSY